MIDNTTLTNVAGILQRADVQRLLFITGAGLSADSGLPTYRGIGGLYEGRLTDEDIPIEVALSGEVLRTQPHICWKYIYAIESACRGAKYNEGHSAIAELERDFDVCVLTQNVDGFHRAAGSTNVIEIHGNIHALSCTACDYKTQVVDYSELTIPPICQHCYSTIRPDVVLFGELLSDPAIEHLQKELAQGFDIVFSVGTSSGFPYIITPLVEAKERGIPTVEINPGETDVSQYVDYKISERAAKSLVSLKNSSSFFQP